MAYKTKKQTATKKKKVATTKKKIAGRMPNAKRGKRNA